MGNEVNRLIQVVEGAVAREIGVGVRFSEGRRAELAGQIRDALRTPEVAKRIDIGAFTPAERVLYYRSKLLVETATLVARWDGPKDPGFNAVLECFAMQARILMELLGIRRKEKPPDRDVRAQDFSPGADWKPPTDPRFQRWMDACDRGAAHPTTGARPEWNEQEMTAAIMDGIRSLVESGKVAPALREWIQGAAAVATTPPTS